MGLRDLLLGDHPGLVYMVGIGGVGVSGVARILHREGVAVAGSDRSPSPVTDELLKLGIPVRIGHDEGQLPEAARLVVRSAAIPDANPEVALARARGIPLVKYAEALGALMQDRRGVAIAGTHGKTTTTAMTAHLLVEAGWDPTMVVGGNIPSLGGTSRVGRSDIVVAEACEFDRSFLHLRPTYAAVTNIEADHLDYYLDLDEIRGAFRAFAEQVPAHGAVVCCAEDQSVPAALAGVGARLVTYAIEDDRASLTARGVRLAGGRPRYNLFVDGRDHGEVELRIPGRHNVLNSLAALGLAHSLGVPLNLCRAALPSFPGVNRRFQVLYDQDGVAVVDDYAHHPSELGATLAAARQRFPERALVCVFQPHQYSRTRHLFEGFVESLAKADVVVIPDIYGARDSDADRRAVGASDLVDALRQRGVESYHEPCFDRLARLITEPRGGTGAAAGTEGGAVLLTAGAGDVYRVAGKARDVLLARRGVAGAPAARSPAARRPHARRSTPRPAEAAPADQEQPEGRG